MKPLSPVVIYQMGKVGSSSIMHSLERLQLAVPVHHVHFLSWKNIETIECYYRNSVHHEATLQHLDECKRLRAKIDQTRGTVKWKVISLVRDPVARDISDVFQNMERDFAHISSIGKEEAVKHIVKHIQKIFHEFDESVDYACTWFDKEMKDVFGLDVFSTHFDKQSGYSLYPTPDADIVIMRTEDLTKCGSAALQDLLEIPGIDIRNRNIGSQKAYARTYKAVIDALQIPEHDLNKVYSSRYARHFYSEEELARFKMKWTKKTDAPHVRASAGVMERQTCLFGRRKILMVHPEGNINYNPNLSGLVTILCEQGYLVDIYCPVRKDLQQESPCHGARIFIVDGDDDREKTDFLLLFSCTIFHLSEGVSQYISTRFQGYDLIVGIDRGIIGAHLLAAVMGIPYGLISYELLFADEAGMHFKEPDVRASRNISFAICQDDVRSYHLSREYRIPLEKIINIPVAGRSIQKGERTYFLHDTLKIDRGKKIAIYIGHINSPWTGIDELLDTTHRWNDWALVLHHRYGNSETMLKDYFRKHGNPGNVFISPASSMPLDQLHILIQSADIGIAYYIPQCGDIWAHNNLRYVGMSSGKIATYLRYGLPVLINEIGEMSQLVRDHQLGLVIKDVSHTASALAHLTRQTLDSLRESCFRFFETRLDLNVTAIPLLNLLDALFSKEDAPATEGALSPRKPLWPQPNGQARSWRQFKKSRTADGTRHRQAAANAVIMERPDGCLVSAIVSTYNSERFMRGCLEDLVSQTIADQMEIIVIDSGSEENERAIVEEFKKSHHNIRYLRTEREPLYAAWNRAIRMARGLYLTNANTDDRHRRDAFEIMAQALDREEDTDVVYSDQWMTFTENATFEDLEAGRVTDGVELNRPSFHPRILVQHCFIGSQPMWRASLHHRVGLFETSFFIAGDYEFWLRCAINGIQFRHIPEKLGCYLNSHHSIEHVSQGRNREELLKVQEGYTSPDIFRHLLKCDRMTETLSDADLMEEYACDCLAIEDTNGGVFCQPERALRVFQLLSREYQRIPNQNNLGVALIALGGQSFGEGRSWLTRAAGEAADPDTRAKALANLQLLSTCRQEPLEKLRTRFLLARKLPPPDNKRKDAITRSAQDLLPVMSSAEQSMKDPACPCVSVIIPCYNHGIYLHDSVGSVVRQSFADWECLIVNDGSTDNSLQVANALMNGYPDKNIRVLDKPHGGPGDARNFGIRASRGRLILPLDADDMISPKMLEATVSLLEKNPDISIAYTDARNFGTVQGPSPTLDYDLERLKHEGLFAYSALFRKEAWKDAGGYNPNMVLGYEDWDFWISCGEKGHYGMRIPEPLFLYRIKAQSLITTSRKHDAFLKAQIILNHESVYGREQVQWAQDVQDGRLFAERWDPGMGRIPKRYEEQVVPVPSVTVIIPTFNRETLLPRAVRSVLSQTFSDLELILVDDGSTDGTKQFVKSFSDPRIRYYRHASNKGQNAALNTGIQHARGSYIAFLDSDDEWLPQYLEKIMARFAQEPSLGAVYSRAYNKRKDGVIEEAQRFELQGNVYRETLAQGYLSHMITLVVRKDVFEKTGLFDTDFVVCQDDDFCFRLARHYAVGLIAEPLAIVYNDAKEGRLITDIRKYAEGWRRLMAKYDAEILEQCGYEVLAAHKEREGRLFLESGDILQALHALCRSAELLKSARAPLSAQPKTMMQEISPSQEKLSEAVAAGVKKCWTKAREAGDESLCTKAGQILGMYFENGAQPAGPNLARVSKRGYTLTLNLDLDRATMLPSLMLKGEYQPLLVKWLEGLLHPGDTFIDVGANIGYLTFIAAGLVGKEGQVHAFEPMPEYFSYLDRFVRENNASQVQINNCGLGEAPRIATLYCKSDNIGMNTFVPGVAQANNCQVIDGIRIITFDEYAASHSLGRVTLMKLDTEGFEYFVLKGMRGFLSRHRPPIICEVNNFVSGKLGMTLEPMKRFMREMGYESFALEDPSKQVDIMKIEMWGDVVFLPVLSQRTA